MIELLIDAMSAVSGCDGKDIVSSSREHLFVTCRFLLFYYLHKHCGWSLMGIGRIFERNHSSVYHGIKKAEDMLNVPGYGAEKAMFERFMNKCYGYEEGDKGEEASE